MNKLLTLGLAVLLSACQSLPTKNDYADTEHLPQTEAAFLQRTHAQQTLMQGQQVKEQIYFNRNWQHVYTPDPQGYYRQSYGLQDNGLFLVQDFFADGRKQTDAFYSADVRNSDAATARGYLSVYDEAGRLLQVYFIPEANHFRMNGFCGGVLCIEHVVEGNRSDQRFLKDGKRIEQLIENENDSTAEWQLQRWYANGRPALKDIRSTEMADAEGKVYRRQYWLPDGVETKNEPDDERFKALEQQILAIEKTVYGQDRNERSAQP